MYIIPDLQNIFKTQFSKGNEIIWNGKSDIEKVKNNAVKNSANVTKYAFCRKGGFFKQMPVPMLPYIPRALVSLPSSWPFALC